MKQLYWSAKPPTKPGFYWVRMLYTGYDYGYEHIEEISEDQIRRYVLNIRAEWAGPIEKPKEKR